MAADTGNGVELDTSELVAAMVKLRAGIERVADTATRSTADDVAAKTRSTVPRRSGRLAGSVTSSSSPEGATARMGAPYAGWIEHGGSRGRPYVAEGRYMGAAARGSDVRMARLAESRLELVARSL